MAPCEACDGMGFDDAKGVTCLTCRGHGEIADKKEKTKRNRSPRNRGRSPSPRRCMSPQSSSIATVEVDPAAWPTLEIASVVPEERKGRSSSPRKQAMPLSPRSRTRTDTEGSRSTRADSSDLIDTVKKHSPKKHFVEVVGDLKTASSERKFVRAGAADTDADKAEKASTAASDNEPGSPVNFFAKLWWYQRAETAERVAGTNYDVAAPIAPLVEANADTQEKKQCIVM